MYLAKEKHTRNFMAVKKMVSPLQLSLLDSSACGVVCMTAAQVIHDSESLMRAEREAALLQVEKGAAGILV